MGAVARGQERILREEETKALYTDRNDPVKRKKKFLMLQEGGTSEGIFLNN